MTKFTTILEKTIPGLGYELVDVGFSPAKLIQVFIDKLDGSSVTIEDCEYVSNHLTRLFMVEELDFNRLEVSSPGLERPLKRVADFVRFLGKPAKIKLHLPINQSKTFYGVIGATTSDNVSLLLDDGTIFECNIADISKARLVFEVKKKFQSKRTVKKK